MYQFVRFRIKQNIISSQKLIQIEVPEKIIFPNSLGPVQEFVGISFTRDRVN